MSIAQGPSCLETNIDARGDPQNDFPSSNLGFTEIRVLRVVLWVIFSVSTTRYHQVPPGRLICTKDFEAFSALAYKTWIYFVDLYRNHPSLI